MQTLKTGCRQNKFQCALTGLDIALTATDFVRFGVEIKLYNDRIEQQRLEFERQRNQSIEDQRVFLEELERIQGGPDNGVDGIDRKWFCLL